MGGDLLKIPPHCQMTCRTYFLELVDVALNKEASGLCISSTNDSFNSALYCIQVVS